MSNLESIAKQVSLLNRLLELLRMQEEPKKLERFFDPFLYHDGYRWKWVYNYNGQKHALVGKRERPDSIDQQDQVLYFNHISDVLKHPEFQKAWSDELVKVARELVKYQYSPVPSSVVYHLRRLYDEDGKVGCTYEKILNKYGRSLSE